MYLLEPSAWRFREHGDQSRRTAQALQPWLAMSFAPVLTLLLLFLILAPLVCWLVLYILFCNSVEKRWAAEVLHLLQDAENCVRLENRQLRELEKERDAKARSLREEAFAAHLSEYSVDELEAYPGIGPSTVGKLRAAGFVNLARLHRAQIQIHGLGEKRLGDIKNAIRNLLGKARSTFDTGNCRQTHKLADQLETLSTRYDRLEERASTRAQAAEEFIDHLGESVEYARRATFWRWFRPISHEALIPSDVMDASLPDLETALQAAEQQSARSGTAKPSPRPANAVPILPISMPCQAVPHAQAPKHAPAIAPQAEPQMSDETHVVLMELTIQFALGVARADGPVTWTERELIQQHVRNRFSYNRALLNRAEALCAHYDTAAIDWERCLGEINRRFTTGHRTALMEFAGQIVAVSGKEAGCAAPFLLRLAQSLGVPPLALPQAEPPAAPLVPAPPPPSRPAAVNPAISRKVGAVRVAAAAPQAAPQPSPTVPAPLPPPPVVSSPPPTRPIAPPPKPAGPTKDQCLSLLEIPTGTPLSADLVRRQWNLLSERLDSEKVASMGPEFVKLAQAKLATLRQAAESLLEAMGEKLETKPSTPPVQDLRHNPDLDDVFGGM